jgi:hypothetical protein
MDSLNGLLSADSTASSAVLFPASDEKQKSVVKELQIAASAPDASSNSVIIGSIGSYAQEDKVSVSFQDLYKGLSITGKQIIDALNQQLGEFAPGGIQNLKPEDVTPEATADRIVTGATAFFDAYSKQHPNLEGEDLVNGFMNEIRKGIGQGYDDAVKILDGLGAFNFDGVKDGIEKTKSLIEEKLVAFENQKRKELGLAVKETETSKTAETTKNEVLAQAGTSLSVVA